MLPTQGADAARAYLDFATAHLPGKLVVTL
jgi:hypothetical protein